MLAYALTDVLTRDDQIGVLIRDPQGAYHIPQLAKEATPAGPAWVIRLPEGAAAQGGLAGFQKAAFAQAVYAEAGAGSIAALNILIAGLAGEAGEVAKLWRDVLLKGHLQVEDQERLDDRLSDLFWHLAALATEMHKDLAGYAELSLRRSKAWKQEYEHRQRQTELALSRRRYGED